MKKVKILCILISIIFYSGLAFSVTHHVLDPYAKDITAMSVINENQILTGDVRGEIKLWDITSVSPFRFRVTQKFFGHSEAIRILKLLPNGRFVSIDKTGKIRVWKIGQDYCERVFERCYVPFSVDSLAVLPDGLIAVGGYSSLAWGSVYILDTNTGECLFSEINMEHRPGPIELATLPNGYLVVQGHYGTALNIWKINRDRCRLVNSYQGDRIYSMASSGTGDIITGGFSLNRYKFLHGKLIEEQSYPNSNVIDYIFPIGAYRILTIDRAGACSNRVQLWNCLTGQSSPHDCLGTTKQIIALLNDNTFLLIRDDGFYLHTLPEELLRIPKGYAEIAKNGRVLNQAYRTNTGFFSRLPREINVMIAALTGDYQNQAISERIASNYFCRPDVTQAANDTGSGAEEFYTDEIMNQLLDIYFGTTPYGQMHALNINAENGEVFFENLRQREDLIVNAGNDVPRIIIPINLGEYNIDEQYAGTHWAGLVIFRQQVGIGNPQILYFDPLGQDMPVHLQKILHRLYPTAAYIINHDRFQIDSHNCGPWVIEFFRSLITRGTLDVNSMDFFRRLIDTTLDIDNARAEHERALQQIRNHAPTIPVTSFDALLDSRFSS